MSFKIVTDASARTESTGGDNDFDLDKYLAKNLEVIELLETQNNSEVLTGVVSGYIALGKQPRPDFEDKYDAADPKHQEKLTKGSYVEDRYDKDAKGKIPMLCTPRTPAEAFTLTVDFPDYMQEFEFSGEKVMKPYRMYMGGDWRVIDPDNAERKMKIVQNHMFLMENTNNPHKDWALPVNGLPAKMCVAAGLGNDKGLVSKDQVSSLLGMNLQFEVRVWNKPDKVDANKSWFTESIKFAGKVPKGMPSKELPEGTEVFGVNFNTDNDPNMLKQVRALAKNTMKLAENYADSVIKKEIETSRSGGSQQASTPSAQTPSKQPEKPVAASSPVSKANVPVEEESSSDEGWDDDNKYPF